MRFSLGGGTNDLNSFGGGKRLRERRDEKPKAGMFEEAPVYGRERLRLRYSPHLWNTVWGASALGYGGVLTRLFESGVPVDLPDPAGKTALHYAVEFQQTDTLCLLATQGANPDARDREGQSPLHLLASGGPRMAEILTALVNADADLDALNDAGRTCLMQAAVRSEIRLLTALLDAGASPRIASARGHTSLLLAAFEGRSRAVERLIGAGAETGFGEAVALGNTPLASQLPTNLDLSQPVHNGETLLHRAARRGDFAGVHLLLERGADPNPLLSDDKAPLDAAADASRGRIVRLLLDYGADPARAVTQDARTLLNWAGR